MSESAAGGEQDQRNRQALAAALAATTQVAIAPTASVEYRSHGLVLVIGPRDEAIAAAQRLAGQSLAPCVLATDGAEGAQDSFPVLQTGGHAVRLEGYLGQFQVIAEGASGPVNLARALAPDREYFDLVLDLGSEPLVGVDLTPFGYYASCGNADALEQALQELPDMVGEFEKPRYFEYDPDICAHGRSGLKGCTRCLDTCPTGAITSLHELIQVDPYLCQGGGVCATACPTGAIIYAYPKPADLLNRLRRLLRSYRDQGGTDPVLLFFDSENGAPLVRERETSLAGRIIPIEVEELGSVGLDAWLCCLAFGARGVLLLDTPQVPERVRSELCEQIDLASAILRGLGYAAAIRLVSGGEIGPGTQALSLENAMRDIPLAGFLGSNRKRDSLYYALDHLRTHAPAAADPIPMPDASPFGAIRVDEQACTLCMACVSVCPASALSDGVDKPQLGFIEANCVQCGLCDVACPENAITLLPRLLLDRDKRMTRRVLNEEEPFHCVVCGKPFATMSVIERMQDKLRGHWMFQDADARRRLQMCQDCRVKDMFESENRL